MVKKGAYVLLVRHGKAEDSHSLGDAARALTAEGRDEFRGHARQLARYLTLQGIYTSPAVRAVQTAELLAEACGVSQIEVRGELEMDAASARSIEALCRAAGPGYALVGHNPSMAEALGHLVGHPGSAPQFRKGGAAALTPGPSLPWQLAWMAAPGKKMRQEIE